VVQINGKVRDRVEVPAGISEAEANDAAMNSESVKRALNGGSAKKIIFIAARNGQEPKINVVV
jgi:leucyl-tRNA synthetase